MLQWILISFQSVSEPRRVNLLALWSIYQNLLNKVQVISETRRTSLHWFNQGFASKY